MSVAIRKGSASTNGTTKRPAKSAGPHPDPSAAAELGARQKIIDAQSKKSRGSAVSCRTRANTGDRLASKRLATPSARPEPATNSPQVTRCGCAVVTSGCVGKAPPRARGHIIERRKGGYQGGDRHERRFQPGGQVRGFRQNCGETPGEIDHEQAHRNRLQAHSPDRRTGKQKDERG